jgi:hypothetical protein
MTGLAQKTCYDFEVRSRNSAGTSSWVLSTSSSALSNGCCTIYDKTPPSKPTNFKVTDTGYSYFKLGWTGVAAGDLAGYRIQALKGSSCLAVQGTNAWYQLASETGCPGGTTSWTVKNLTEGCYYKFRICSVDVNKNASAWVEVGWVKTGFNTSLVHPPEKVSACRFPSSGKYGVRVTWTPPDYTANIKGYRVYLHKATQKYYYTVTGASATTCSINYTWTTGAWQQVSVKSLSLDNIESGEVYAPGSDPYPNCP